ncbi:MAG: hypothetical protein K8T90_19960 [Planctomycetes bacterium]|nr:hypothetical protein [Planctomycetota bacterium]
MPKNPELRPRTVGEILDASFHLYRQRFGPLLLASTILSIPTLAASVLLSDGAGAALGDYMTAAMRYMEASGSSGGKFSPAMTEALNGMMAQARDVQLYTILSSVFQSVSRAGGCLAGAMIAFAAVRHEPTPSGWTMVRGSLGKLATGSAIHLFAALVGAFCAICLPIPIFVGVLIAPACAALVAETGPREQAVTEWRVAPLRWLARPDAAGIDVAVRCFSLSMHGMTLVRGSFLVPVVLFFVTAIVTVLSVGAGFVAKSWGVWFVAQHYAEVLFLPVIGIAFALWYLDLRVRREGIDLAEDA